MTAKQKQCLLCSLGYYDKFFEAATKAFQEDYGLTANGIFDNATETKILSVIATGESPKTSVEETKNTGDFWSEIKYFKRSEFACKCGKCGGYPAEPKEKLIRVADQVRKNLGGAAIVSSGVRCATHNANVGGVANSRHLSGKAMDFRVVGKTSTQVLTEVNKYPEIRYAYAIDSNYVHMDIN